MTNTDDDREPVKTGGLVLHAPVFYDLAVQHELERERAFRKRLLALAHLKLGTWTWAVAPERWSWRGDMSAPAT